MATMPQYKFKKATVTLNTMDEFQKHHAKKKTSNTKEYFMLYDSIYMTF